MEKLKNHNNAIEAKYLDHELNKFKKEISISHSRLLVADDSIEHNALSYKPLDNSNLISSFSHGHECVENFYKESENATLMEDRIFANLSDAPDVVDTDMLNEDIDCINHILDSPMNTDDRYVRFGDLVEIINYDEAESAGSPANSDGSPLGNVKDMREELRTEVEPVLEVKLVPKEQSLFSDPKLELIGKQMQQSVEEVTKARHEQQHPKITSVDELITEDKCENESNPFIITRLDVTSKPKSLINASDGEKEIQIQIPPEQKAIVSDLFAKEIHSENMRRNILQKCFLRWIHFTTIEKLSKDNIACNQSRIQKIEAFLNNIRLEKRKQLRNDDRIVDVKKKVSAPENPIVLARKYHHK